MMKFFLLVHLVGALNGYDHLMLLAFSGEPLLVN